MTTEPGGSVTRWLGGLTGGDEADAATQALWQRYFDQLVRLARARLGAAPRGPADEEDVALSAFDSFHRGAVQGRFPRLGDRGDLWRLLVTITARKAADHLARECRQRRGGGRVVGEATLDAADPEVGRWLEQVVGREPTPAFAAQVVDECRRLLGSLGDEGLRTVALLRMEGYSNDQIAERLGCALRSVERKLARIRKQWLAEVTS
jgi:DNA-directed RNA polymerase specialized sigma24 family protein